ncbi:transmembrane signal receptor [Lithospermum erythrorhizon]|uniref:Transmembrane signal receptor n=1 Tax=Lithospermum erythrorhizon TaxID=34254 RepID=A0AAV3RYH3_LITER
MLHAPSRTKSNLNSSVSSTSTSHPMTTRSKDGITKPRILPSLLSTECAMDFSEPSSYTQASKDPLWRSAMPDEYNALMEYNTWSLVPPPSVAQGQNRQQGSDYNQTFSPVIKPVTIRTVLMLAASKGWLVHQLDVKNAFLHGELAEEVFFKQPTGFIDPEFSHHVCRLNKALYGLKQAPRAWFSGFSSSRSDPSMFHLLSDGEQAVLLLYVDDILLTASSPSLLNRIITQLKTEFAMTDLEAEYRAVAHSVAEVDWLQSLMSELHIPLSCPPVVLCDNISTTYMASNPVKHARTKHKEIDVHFVRERVAKGALKDSYVSTVDQLAEFFTKSLSTDRFNKLRFNLGIHKPHATIEGE